MGLQLLMAAVKASHTSVQWWTLAWIAGAAVVAAVTIGIIVVVSRRPKSMEDGMAEFSRSLPRSGLSGARSGPAKTQEERAVRATRGDTEGV